jgi:hypothetical protein
MSFLVLIPFIPVHFPLLAEQKKELTGMNRIREGGVRTEEYQLKAQPRITRTTLMEEPTPLPIRVISAIRGWSNSVK